MNRRNRRPVYLIRSCIQVWPGLKYHEVPVAERRVHLRDLEPLIVVGTSRDGSLPNSHQSLCLQLRIGCADLTVSW